MESYSPTGLLRKSVDEFDKLSEGKDDEDKVDANDYMQLVGNILWVADMTRPDIAYYCSRLAMYCKNPTKRHEYFALRIVGYLLKTKDQHPCWETAERRVTLLSSQVAPKGPNISNV